MCVCVCTYYRVRGSVSVNSTLPLLSDKCVDVAYCCSVAGRRIRVFIRAFGVRKVIAIFRNNNRTRSTTHINMMNDEFTTIDINHLWCFHASRITHILHWIRFLLHATSYVIDYACLFLWTYIKIKNCYALLYRMHKQLNRKHLCHRKSFTWVCGRKRAKSDGTWSAVKFMCERKLSHVRCLSSVCVCVCVCHGVSVCLCECERMLR